MREEIALSVGTITADLMFDSCTPNQGILERALSFNASHLDSMTDSELSQFIVVLGQYLVYLKYKENECTVRKIELNKQYDYECFKLISQKSWKTNTTVKEKMRVVVEESASLKELEKDKDVAESKMTIIDGMYGAFSEYLNAYKKEQGRRLYGRGFEAKNG